MFWSEGETKKAKALAETFVLQFWNYRKLNPIFSTKTKKTYVNHRSFFIYIWIKLHPVYSMRYSILIFIIQLSLLFISCSEEVPVNTNTIPNNDTLKYCDSLSLQTMNSVSDPKNEDTLRLDFFDFQIEFPHLSTFDNDKIQIKDTTELFLDLESSVDSAILIIKGENIASISLTEQFQTAISIQDEGPHIELYDWKNHQSDWIKVDSVSPFVYRLKYISEQENGNFPKFSKEELINAALKYGDEHWSDLIKNPPVGSWKDQFWIGVGVRRIKINGISNTGKPINKLLIIYPAMGC